MGDQIRTNGREFDGSIVMKLAGDEFGGFTEITYDDGIEEVLTYGAQRYRGPRGRTNGKYVPGKVTLKGPKKAVRALTSKLAELGGGVLTKPIFQGTVAYLDGGGDSITDTLGDLRLLKRKGEVKGDTADPATEELELGVLYIKWDGATMFDTAGKAL